MFKIARSLNFVMNMYNMKKKAKIVDFWEKLHLLNLSWRSQFFIKIYFVKLFQLMKAFAFKLCFHFFFFFFTNQVKKCTELEDDVFFRFFFTWKLIFKGVMKKKKKNLNIKFLLWDVCWWPVIETKWLIHVKRSFCPAPKKWKNRPKKACFLTKNGRRAT